MDPLPVHPGPGDPDRADPVGLHRARVLAGELEVDQLADPGAADLLFPIRLAGCLGGRRTDGGFNRNAPGGVRHEAGLGPRPARVIAVWFICSRSGSLTMKSGCSASPAPFIDTARAAEVHPALAAEHPVASGRTGSGRGRSGSRRTGPSRARSSACVRAGSDVRIGNLPEPGARSPKASLRATPRRPRPCGSRPTPRPSRAIHHSRARSMTEPVDDRPTGVARRPCSEASGQRGEGW
jgi:hypothetical protein